MNIKTNTNMNFASSYQGLKGFTKVIAVFSLFVFCITNVGFVMASSSGSYQLNSALDTDDQSRSSSYTLCSRFGSVASVGSSPSYSLQPSLNCSEFGTVETSSGGRRRSQCGNSEMEGLEQCDDGNQLSGDGCSASCENEIIGGTGTTGTGTTGTGTTGTGTTGTGTTGTGTTGTGTTGTGTTGTGTTGTGTTGTSETGTTGTGTTGTGTTETGTTGTGDTDAGTSEPVEPETEEAPEDIIPYIPGITMALCGNGLEELGEQCDDGNLRNADGCNSMCNAEALIFEYPFEGPILQTPFRPSAPIQPVDTIADGQTYLTNDITAFFFEQFSDGSGTYLITLRDKLREYQIEVIPTAPGYFSFRLLEELPDGFYSMSVVDQVNTGRALRLNLQVVNQEIIESAMLTEFDGDVLGDVSQALQTFSLQPSLSGQTILPATLALYSMQLQQTFIVYTDAENNFEFQYPESLSPGLEELSIIAHYENGHISRPQVLKFEVFGNAHSVALEPGSFLYTYLGTAILFLMATLASLSFAGILKFQVLKGGIIKVKRKRFKFN